MTFVLILLGMYAVTAVPGYTSLADCEAAAKVAVEQSSRHVSRAYCIPGPVRP